MVRRKFEPPRGLLKTGVVARQGFRHARYYPSPDLDRYVEHYWAVEWDLRERGPERVATLPHPSVHLIFEPNGGSRITGVVRSKFSRWLKGKGGVIAAKFRPGGFYPFVGIPISTFSDANVAIRRVFGAAGDEVNRKVLAETSDASRIAIIEDFLRSRRTIADDNVSRIADIVYAVAWDRGILKVEDLVERYGTNKRTLQRLFAKYVGVSPKWVIQLYRLHEAARQLDDGGSISQSALALSLGYSDQAHFVRDFKRIVGVTPMAYSGGNKGDRNSPSVNRRRSE